MRYTPEHVLKIVDGLKSQTRRLWQNSWTVKNFLIPDYLTGEYTIQAIFDHNGRLRWEVGRSYAVQIGGGALYGRPAVARYTLAGIRKEPLQAISEADARAEGFDQDWGYFPDTPGVQVSLSEMYHRLWNSINKRKCHQWAANPFVVVLEWDPDSVEIVRPGEFAALRERLAAESETK